MANISGVFRNGLIFQRNKQRFMVVPKTLLVILIILGVDYAVHGSNSRRTVKLLTKSGKYLTIIRNQLKGADKDTPNAEFELYSAGFNGEVTIEGVASGLYITMGSVGNISLKSSQTSGATFIDDDIPGILGFRSFQSKLYSTKYLAIDSNGNVASITLTDNTAVAKNPDLHFAVIDTTKK